MASEPIISFIPENDDAFKRGIDRLSKATDDFRIPFGLIANHWYKGNRKLFKLKSGGLYAPYGGINPTSEKTAAAERAKKRDVGFVFPMMKRSGRLEQSLVSKNSSETEHFVGKQTLVMGTKVPYAKFHQSDKPRSVLPQRKVVFIDGGPAEKAKDALVSGRREAWLNIMNDYIIQLLDGEL